MAYDYVINTELTANTTPGSKISFEMVATVAGEYTMKTNFLGSILEIKGVQVLGEKLSFPTDKLNEHYSFCVEIFSPGGARVGYEFGGYIYTWFIFHTRLKYEL